MDYVLLQSNPIHHWVPITDEFENSTDESSIDSLTLHPIHRSSSQRSITSRCSIMSTCSANQKPQTKYKKSSRPQSLLISPPPSPGAVRLSKSIDNNFEVQSGRRRSSTSKPSRFSSSIGEEISILVPVHAKNSSKIGRFKEKLMSGKSQKTEQQTNIGDESDSESTPLVSELSTPTHSNSDNCLDQTPSSPENNSFSPSTNASKLHHYGGEHVVEMDSIDSFGLISQESSSGRSLSRQDAQEWENSETPV